MQKGQKERIIPYELREAKDAVTIFASAEVERENHKEILTTPDIENGIAQTIWKLFDEYRSDAAEKLGIDDLEACLVNAIVTGAKIDGHQVINPHGFTGKRLEIMMGATFSSRKATAPGKYILEPGAVYAYLLSRKHDTYPFVLVWVKDEVTNVYAAYERHVHHVDSFQWGNDVLRRTFKDESSLPEETSDVLYEAYLKGKVSEQLHKKLDIIFDGAFDPFLQGVGSSLKKISTPRGGKVAEVRLASLTLPGHVYMKRFLIDKNKVAFLPVKLPPIERFIRDIVGGPYAELNQISGRRVKWLMNA